MAMIQNGNWAVVDWNITAVGPGGAVDIAAYPDKTLTVTGTFGGTTVTLEGSNDGVNWVGLADNTGTAISLTDEGSVVVGSHTRYLRPVATSGTGIDLAVSVIGTK